MAHTYAYPRPALTVDIVLFGIREDKLELLFIERKNPPFQDTWALPGGFVDEHEDLKDAALRELQEETSVTNIELAQLGAYGKPGRDPRGHTVSVAFYGMVNRDLVQAKAQDDAKSVQWFPSDRLPDMAFDHKDIVLDGLRALQANSKFQPIGRHILPEVFTLEQLGKVYAAVFGKHFDLKTFEKRIRSRDILVDQEKTDGNGKALYAFDDAEYDFLREEGFFFQP